jgi:hypothetical protein
MLTALAAGLALAAAGGAQAQRADPDPTLDQLVKLVGDAMPPIIGDSNVELVDKMLNVKLGKPLSQTFNFNTARAAVFGPRITPNLSPDCPRISTPSGDPDQGECMAFVGDEKGDKAYRSLSYSKNLGLGNVRFLFRPDVVNLNPEDLKPVVTEDGEVYAKGLDWLGRNFGLPLEELPPPPDARTLPVRSLTIGFDPKVGADPVVVQKVVNLRRGLELASPIVLPGTNLALTHLPAPGGARIAFAADGSVVNASINHWVELRRNDKIAGRLAKGKSALVQEIAEDLFQSGGGSIDAVKILIGLSSASQGTFGWLLPAVQVQVLLGGRDAQPGTLTSTPYIREYSLVELEENALVR